MDTGGNVWHSAPYQSAPLSTGSVQGAWAAPGDEVEWVWTHTPAGSYVSGYTVKRGSAVDNWRYVDAEKEVKDE